MPRIFCSDSALPSRISFSFLSSMLCFSTSSRRCAIALEVGELDLLGPLVPLGAALHGVDLLVEGLLGLRRARRWPRPRPALVFSASSLSNVFDLASSTSSRRCTGRFLRRPTNDSSPASTSTQLSTNGTLSNSRSSIFRRRSSKNCSPMKSRSAIAITLIFAGRPASRLSSSRRLSCRHPWWRLWRVGRRAGPVIRAASV